MIDYKNRKMLPSYNRDLLDSFLSEPIMERMDQLPTKFITKTHCDLVDKTVVDRLKQFRRDEAICS